MEKPGKVYLRGQIYEVYTGSRWEAADTKDTAAYEELFYWLHKDGFYGQSQIGTASRWALTAAEPLAMTVKNLTACAAHGYYPYALYGSGLLDAAQIGDAGLPAAEELRYLTGSVRNGISSSGSWPPARAGRRYRAIWSWSRLMRLM